MKVLFLTLSSIDSILSPGIYTDLLRRFVAAGDDVYVATAIERRQDEPTRLLKKDGVNLLKIRTLNIQKTNLIEKGIGTILLNYQYKYAVRKHLGNEKFDLILYATPPITLTSVISYLKKSCGATTYLMLKDIFPQNAVDIALFSRRSLFYRFFRSTEKKLYAVSDFIGCMSPANCAYLLEQNPEITPERVELCPNSLEITTKPIVDCREIRARYMLPADKRIFIYGGNLGKPQGIEFILTVLEANIRNEEVHFVIVGGGTEFPRVAKWVAAHRPQNVTLMAQISTNDYDQLVRSCDVGMIFLDLRFTIPNYPSRLLSYIGNSMPVLLATDLNTDVGRIAVQNSYGFWSLHGDTDAFNCNLQQFARMPQNELEAMGQNGYRFFAANYDVGRAYTTIVSHFG